MVNRSYEMARIRNSGEEMKHIKVTEGSVERFPQCSQANIIYCTYHCIWYIPVIFSDPRGETIGIRRKLKENEEISLNQVMKCEGKVSCVHRSSY
jgi:hypothetical protein